MRSCLIADDHAMVREALAATVTQRWPGTRVLHAADFPSAWALAAATNRDDAPDLCLADLGMPGASALDGIDGLRAVAPDMPILVVTGDHDDAMMLAMLQRGVAGFAPKTLNAEVVASAIALVLAGGRYLPERLAALAITPAPPPAPPLRPALLSERQIEVVRLMAQGLSNKDIARALGVAPATIKTHVANVIALTGAANRTDAAMRASGQGLL